MFAISWVAFCKFYQNDYIPKQMGSGTTSSKADLPRDITMPMQ